MTAFCLIFAFMYIIIYHNVLKDLTFLGKKLTNSFMPKSLDQGPLCYINMRLLRLRHWCNNGNGRNDNFVATIWQ